MAECEGPGAQMVRLILGFYLYWQEDVAKIPKVPGAPAQCKSVLE